MISIICEPAHNYTKGPTSKNIKKITTIAALIFAVGILPAGPAAADSKCKKAVITVSNDLAYDIRIYKIKYYDNEDQKWRTSNFSNKKVVNGGSVNVTKSLTYVGGESIGNMQIQYKPLVSGSKRWSTQRASGVTSCSKGQRISHSIG